MSESRAIDFLYGTAVGRFILKGLVNPWVSDLASGFLSSRISSPVIPSFIKKNRIDMDEYVIPEGGFRSFNDFFIRKIKPGKRVIASCEMICPCDGLLSICAIDETSVFNIKNSSYSLGQLLGNEELAKEYTGGTAFVFRLTPSHYHRYVFCASGNIEYKMKIRGKLHSVKPVCHEHFPVFAENSREYIVLNTDKLGEIIQMEVGALLVGKISNMNHYIDRVHAGEEKGYFEYGGSSIVVLVKSLPDKERSFAKKMTSEGEMPVKMGEGLIEI